MADVPGLPMLVPSCQQAKLSSGKGSEFEEVFLILLKLLRPSFLPLLLMLLLMKMVWNRTHPALKIPVSGP